MDKASFVNDHGCPQMCHKPDEYIEIEQLEKAKEDYKRIIPVVPE